MKTKVWTVTCPWCRKEMYSRARHDYRVCGCPVQTMVDGGFAGYIRYGCAPGHFTAVKNSFRYRFVKATRDQLYEDYNQGLNKFGIIVGK